jgi:hypothetical protein
MQTPVMYSDCRTRSSNFRRSVWGGISGRDAQSESRCGSASFNRGVDDMGWSGKHALIKRVAGINSLEID